MKTSGFWKSLAVLFAIVTLIPIGVSAQNLTTVHNSPSDGSWPVGLLIQASNGNLVGTTYSGGADWGTIFKITPSGTFGVMWTFTGGSDGAEPYAGVTEDSAGNGYAVTSIGGNTPSGCGTVDKRLPGNGSNVTQLHAFAGPPNDGCTPWAPLVQASDGNLYGTTYAGGSGVGGLGGGTVFRITPSGAETILYNFCSQSGCADGYVPYAGVIQGSDGYLYGATSQGGTGYGTIFKISLSGSGFTVLHNFNDTDGNLPAGGLTQGSDGNFYGTTSSGGANNYGQRGEGTIFKMTPSGTLTSLYSFCSQPNCTDGKTPDGVLLQAADGNFYGTTYYGGGTDSGTVFVITPSGSFTSLYSFCSQANCPDGSHPYPGVIQGSDGKFYGVTQYGGSENAGTVFSLQVTDETLIVSVNGGGTVTSTDGFINCPGSCSHIYQQNTQVTLNATAAGGWVFGTWGGSCGGSSPSCTLTMSQNESVSATFNQLSYTLTVTPPTGSGTVTSSDGYINCPGTCSHSYLSNTVVTLNANPAPGWSLNAWGGACSGNNPSCNVTMTGTETVSATFTQNYYTLTVSMSGDGSITSNDGYINCPGSCSHTYLSLIQVTLNAAPAHGWNFVGWSGACSGTVPCQLTMLGNYGVSAYFIQPGSGSQFSSVTPCRLIDTRNTGNPIQGGTSQNFIIPQLGGCNVPTAASAYSLNVTVVPHGSLGYITVWPAGLAQPLISTTNARDGRTKASAVIVQAGTGDAVSIYASNTTDVILDINGYFGAPGSQTYQFYPMTPCRVIDTRNANSELGGPPLVGGQPRNFAVLTSSCMPQNVTIQAYSFNVTVVPYPSGQPLHYLTVWPEGEAQPGVSTLNNRTATTVANAAIVPAGSNGGISVYASDSTELVVDIVGYFAAPTANGISLYATAPCRVIDTRSGGGQPWRGEKTINVADSTCAPPSNAQAYVFNATVVPPGPMHYLTLWPDPDQQPLASTLNAIDGAVTSNMAIMPNINGSTDAYASDLTQLILDISSFFAP